MITSKDAITPLYGTSNDTSDRYANQLAGTLVENLKDGDFLVSMIPTTVIFIRVDDWNEDLVIEQIAIDDVYQIRLSNGRILKFHSDQIKNALNKVDDYRVVLLSARGFSRFKVQDQSE